MRETVPWWQWGAKTWGEMGGKGGTGRAFVRSWRSPSLGSIRVGWGKSSPAKGRRRASEECVEPLGLEGGRGGSERPPDCSQSPWRGANRDGKRGDKKGGPCTAPPTPTAPAAPAPQPAAPAGGHQDPQSPPSPSSSPQHPKAPACTPAPYGRTPLGFLPPPSLIHPPNSSKLAPTKDPSAPPAPRVIQNIPQRRRCPFPSSPSFQSFKDKDAQPSTQSKAKGIPLSQKSLPKGILSPCRVRSPRKGTAGQGWQPGAAEPWPRAGVQWGGGLPRGPRAQQGLNPLPPLEPPDKDQAPSCYKPHLRPHLQHTPIGGKRGGGSPPPVLLPSSHRPQDSGRGDNTPCPPSQKQQ